MGYAFSARSLRNLQGVHPDLVRVVHRALELTPTDFLITEGLRTLERQLQLVAAGASRTMNSRHLTGHAVDFAPIVGRQVRWDWPLFPPIAKAFKQAAAEKNVAIVWGGDWRTFKDAPHVELDRRVYT
jgi:peptidoglycan L-alanyl-D-glutamate endopeptidase CwlK